MSRPIKMLPGACEMPRPALSLQFVAEPCAIRTAMARFSNWLSAAGAHGEEINDAQIVLAEALNNIAEHAYADAKAGPVRLCATRRGEDLWIELRDHGQPIPEERRPDRGTELAPPDPLALPEGGFGWFMIRQLSSGLSYCRCGGQNHLHLQLPAARATADPGAAPCPKSAAK